MISTRGVSRTNRFNVFTLHVRDNNVQTSPLINSSLAKEDFRIITYSQP